MNSYDKMVIRGLVKEAGVGKEIAKHLAIDIPSAAGGSLLYHLVQKLRGKDTSLMGYIGSGLGGVAVAEAGQGLAKYLNNSAVKERARKEKDYALEQQKIDIERADIPNKEYLSILNLILAPADKAKELAKKIVN